MLITKTLKINPGDITVDISGDRNGGFEPRVIPKHESKLFQTASL